jgi:putative membrane protein
MNNFKAFAQRYGLWSVIALHIFGLFTILIWNAEFFTQFSPLTLLFTTVVLIGTHQGNLKKLGYFLAFSYAIGYGVELLGTQTGFPFGNYWYGKNLRPHILGVPIVIGFNWFILAMASRFVIAKLVKKPWLIIVVSAGLMVFLDLFIEQVAPNLGFWHWENNFVPLENYLAWFVVSLIVQGFAQYWLKESRNPAAAGYFWVVFSFFIIFNIAL